MQRKYVRQKVDYPMNGMNSDVSASTLKNKVSTTERIHGIYQALSIIIAIIFTCYLGKQKRHHIYDNETTQEGVNWSS